MGFFLYKAFYLLLLSSEYKPKVYKLNFIRKNMEKPVLKPIDWGNLNPETEQKYSRLACALEHHVGEFYPTSCIKPIGNVFTCYIMTGQNAKDFLEAHQAGNLEEILPTYDVRFEEFPCFRAAVKDFFEKGLHEKHVPKV